MAVKRGKWLFFVIFLILSFSLSSYFASARVVKGNDTLIGRVVDFEGNPVVDIEIIVSSSTMATQCQLYDACYCNAPRCKASAETNGNGEYELALSELLFEQNYYCNESGGPEINLTTSDRCAPLIIDTHYCAVASEGCINDTAEYMLAYSNDSIPLTWEDLWDDNETRYEYREIGLFDICVPENLKPVIQGTIPSQSGDEGTDWTYDLTPHMDTTINREWLISGVSPATVDISINGNNIVTFHPKREGVDKVLFELYATNQNVSSHQEISISISGTPEDITTINITIEGGEKVIRDIIRGINCGDGNCGLDENCLNCPEDCGSCPGCDPCIIVVDTCHAEELDIPPEEESPKARIPWGILVALTALGAGGLAAWLLTKETLLVVSSRNIMRGPLTQEALRSMLRKKGLDGKYNVKSVGTLAHAGHKPSTKLIRMAEELGVDLSNFETGAITEKDVKKAKHILLMDSKQKDFVINHLLHKNKANLENKMHVLNIGVPAAANAGSYRQSFNQIKKSLVSKFSKITGTKEGPKSGSKANGTRTKRKK